MKVIEWKPKFVFPPIKSKGTIPQKNQPQNNLEKVVKSEIGFPFMVLDHKHKFQMIYLRGTYVFVGKPKVGHTNMGKS
jgi:hypothetical protein